MLYPDNRLSWIPPFLRHIHGMRRWNRILWWFPPHHDNLAGRLICLSYNLHHRDHYFPTKDSIKDLDLSGNNQQKSVCRKKVALEWCVRSKPLVHPTDIQLATYAGLNSWWENRIFIGTSDDRDCGETIIIRQFQMILFVLNLIKLDKNEKCFDNLLCNYSSEFLCRTSFTWWNQRGFR